MYKKICICLFLFLLEMCYNFNINGKIQIIIVTMTCDYIFYKHCLEILTRDSIIYHLSFYHELSSICAYYIFKSVIRIGKI